MKRDDLNSVTLYLLDTNVLSDVIKNPSGKIADRMKSMPSASLITSVVVGCELNFGAEKKGSKALRERVTALLKTIPVLPIGGDEFCQLYAKTRAEMEKRGTIISAHDLLIACQSLLLNAILVTQNVREFSRVPGLKIQSWS